MRKIALIVAVMSLGLSACLGSTTTPPQLPSSWQNVVRGALDFAFNSFDAALYGLDAAIALGKLTPGSDKAKAIAAAGRQVQAGLNGAEAARKAGNSATYEAAIASANAALTQFKSMLGSATTSALQGPPMTAEQRTSVLDRLAA